MVSINTPWRSAVALADTKSPLEEQLLKQLTSVTVNVP